MNTVRGNPGTTVEQGVAMPGSTVSYLWRDADAFRGFRTGVSLHSHTNQSLESLAFVANFGSQYPLLRPLMRSFERRIEQVHGMKANYAESYWTPPMTPRLAFDLESRQIENMGLASMVSITDHDNIHASMLLRSVPSACQIPISLEWTVPYGGVQAFHLGVHNLPSVRAAQWMDTLHDFTAHPSDQRLTEILAALHSEPDVLVVFNHPAWDLYMIGREKHRILVNEFLRGNGAFLHALELNGLRSWHENRATRRMAEHWKMLLISGGDRHGVEPNASINLTSAATFAEFVHEIRCDKESHVLFMPQYAQPWKYRFFQSTLDAVRHFPEFPQGSRTWDERIYHPDASGVIRPLSELWSNEKAPRLLSGSVRLALLAGSGLVTDALRLALTLKDSHQLQLALDERDS
jgi:hypothetical protein